MSAGWITTRPSDANPPSPTTSTGPICITIENPTSAEDIGLMFLQSSRTISKMYGVLRGSGSPSLTFTIRHGSDRSATGTEVVTGGSAITSTTTGNSITVFNNPTIADNSWVWLETTASSGTVNEICIVIFL